MMRSSASLYLIFALTAAPREPRGITIPEVHGVALSGYKVDLPNALEGKAGVLIVGFSQASRDQVTAWGKRMAGSYRNSSDVLYYEMPELAGVPRLLRGWINKKISESVPDRAKDRFLPLYDHEAEWKVAAGYKAADDAYVLVVDSHGAVRFRSEGPPTEQAFAAIQTQVVELTRK